MGRHKKWLVLLLALAGAVFVVVYAPDIFKTGERGDGEGLDDGAPDLLRDGAETGEATGDGSRSTAKGPVLFGRGRAQRKGVGGLMGRVMDFRTGKPVAKARVVTAGEGYGGEVLALQVESDAQGRFQYEAIAAGDAYAVHVSGDDKHQRMIQGVSVEAGEVRDLGTIWLGERGVLEGRVIDEAGTGVVGAEVQVHRGGSLLALLENITDLIEGLDKDALPLAKGKTEAGGRFRIAEVDPGPLLLVTRAPGFRQRMVDLVMTSTGAAGGPVTIRLEASDPILGRVVDETGRGIAGARVALMDPNDMNAMFFGRLFSETDADGRFRIDSPPAQAGYSVIAAAPGYPTLFRKAAAGDKELRLVLAGGAEVRVRLLDKATDRPIEGATLMVMFGETAEMNATTMSYAAGRTDANGGASFAARPGVLSMMYFSHPEHGGGVYAAAMPPGVAASIVEGPEDLTVKKPRTSFVFRVIKGVTIHGRVADEQGNAIAGARVSSLGGVGFGVKTRSDEEGRYVLRGQTKSVMMVLASAPGYVQQNPQIQKKQGTLEPDAQGNLQYDIVMLPAATVAGRVLGPDGAPLPGVRVKLGSKSANSMVTAFMSGGGESITSKEGRYLLDGVPAGGKMYVLARLEGFLDGHSEEFAVKSGATAQAPDVRMLRGARFRVKILSPAGVAVKGARVEVRVERTADQMQWDPTRGFRNFADLTTNADGVVRLEDVPDGGATLTASKDGFASARSTIKVKREFVTGETEVRISLREPHTLSGRVTDGEGKAVAAASIVALSPPDVADDHWIPTVTATADKDGRFELAGLPACPLVLGVRGAGFRTKEAPVADLRGEVEVRLEPISPDAKVRLAEIEKELMGVYQAFANVKNDAERDALLARMRALQKEQADLQGK